MHENNITYETFRAGKVRYLVVARWLSCSAWIYLKMTPEASVDSLEVRFEPPVAGWTVPVPFASMPPSGRAMVRGLAEMVLWEVQAQTAAR